MEEKKEEKQANRTRFVALRLTDEEYTVVEKQWKKTTLKKLSKYLRQVLFGKAVTVNTRDASLDEMMNELSVLRRELNAIGNNFNQAVHRLHTLDHLPQMQLWLKGFERDKDVLFRKVEEIGERMNLMADKWLR